MGSVFKREKQWVVMCKDLAGNWREKRTKCVTKAEAQRLLNEVEVSTQRQRLGLEATPSRRAYQPFSEMLDWWWETEGHLQASAQNVKPFIEKHIRPALGRLAAIEVTDARIKEMMNARLRPRSRSTEKKAKKTGLTAASVNHLRFLVHRIFAIEKREWIAENPAGRVAKEKVVKRHPTHLSFEEFESLLVELDAKWRPLFATAVHTGMRQGELLGLRKSDILFDTGIIKLNHTNTSSTTKDERRGHGLHPQVPEEAMRLLRRERGASVTDLPEVRRHEAVEHSAPEARSLSRLAAHDGHPAAQKRSPDAARPEDSPALRPKPHGRHLRASGSRRPPPRHQQKPHGRQQPFSSEKERPYGAGTAG